ncbi:MAG: type II restriction endonuclease [Prevotellaceae bacterium]|nr:type II restriction endonuclease [Prevotellaceae bacterium]
MQAHTKEQFQSFLSQLRETNATLDFFCDFDKISQNVKSIEVKLNQLNYLLGKENIKEAIYTLWNENPKVFTVLDILIAVRTKDNKQVINEEGDYQYIKYYFDTIEGVIEFIDKTGLGEVFMSKRITNLVDYVFGVETGLDTNARKNRSGKQMEETVAKMLQAKGVAYRKEVFSREFPQIVEALGSDEKRFDFVIETATKTYLIETNFYSGGGSKLNEVARAYTDIAPKINAVGGFEFLWITDGKGWEKAKNKLEEAFYAIPSIYNLTTLKDFIADLCVK